MFLFSTILYLLLDTSLSDVATTISCENGNWDIQWSTLATKTGISTREVFAEIPGQESCTSADLGTDTTDAGNITLAFAFALSECGTTPTTEGTKTVYNNNVLYQITDTHTEGHTIVYKYNYEIKCEVETADGGSVATGSYVEGNSDITDNKVYSSTIDFSIEFDLNFYTDDTFVTTKTEKKVKQNEYIFAKVKETTNNVNFKFVVNECAATQSETYNENDADIFFKDGCKLDTTFEKIDIDADSFAFKIQAFHFSTGAQTIYFHCTVFICHQTSDECTQECQTTNERRRRDVNKDVGRQSKKVIIATKEVVFDHEVTCAELSCPQNSKCYRLQPAECVCDGDYVFSTAQGYCSKERLVRIEDIHVNKQWNPIYSDLSSFEFHKLAITYETLLYGMFSATNATNEIEGIKIINAKNATNKIEGMQIINAKEGNLILDALVRHATTTTPEVAYISFLKSISTDILEVTTARRALKLINDHSPSLVPGVTGTATDVQRTILVMPIVIVLITAVAGILIFNIKKTKTKEVISFDNMGVENSKGS